MKTFLILSKSFFKDGTSMRFAVGVIAGLSFSISVILGTLGLMDGFETTLKLGLKRSMGDLFFFSRDGFFYPNGPKKILEKLDVTQSSVLIQSEGFIIKDGSSKGVLVKGIDSSSFEGVTELKIDVSDGQMALGKELASFLDVGVGGEVVLALAGGSREVKGLPSLQRFKVSQIVDHGVYQKNMRLVYVPLKTLQNILNVGEQINVIALNIPNSENIVGKERLDSIRKFNVQLEGQLGIDYLAKPFWSDFVPLFEAVDYEKKILSLILQLVVVISIFNVVAFFTFLNERKARDIFMFRALGLNKKTIVRSWILLLFVLWIFSCCGAVLLTYFFNYCLQTLPFFALPGDVYYLNRLQLFIGPTEYIMVFASALVWLGIISGAGIYRMSRLSILHGLRKEFY